MPRQIDLTPQNLKVGNNPNVQLGVTQEQISNLQSQIPVALEKAEIAFINAVLEAIDQATGWDLLSFAQKAEAGITYTGNLALDLWNYLAGTNGTANDAWNNWISLLENTERTSIADFTAWLNNAESNAADAWTQIQNFIATGDWSDLTAAWDDLLAALGGTTVAQVQAQAALWTDSWTQIENFIATGDWSDLSAAWNDLVNAIFGSSTGASLLSLIPAPSVSNTAQQAQPVSNFPNASSIQPGGGWAWDGGTTYTDPSTGIASTGSVNFTATGALGALRGVIAAVQPGHVVALSAVLQWSGLTYTGSDPIQLQLVPYPAVTTAGVVSLGDAGTPVVVAQMASPPASGSWTQIGGTYTVPAAGVGFVQMRLVVQNVTAGSVWWANCTETIAGGFLPLIRSDLDTLQDDAKASATAWTTLITSVWSAITNYTTWPTFIAELQSAYSTWQTTEHNIEESESFTLQQLLNSLLGINPDTGQTSLSSIEGAGGFPDLNTTLTNWLSQFGAALNGNVAGAGSLAWVAQLMNDLGVNPNSPIAPLVSTAQTSAQILAIQNNRPASSGLEATVESNGEYTSAATLASGLVTKTTSRGTCFTISQAKTLGFVQWLGNYTSVPAGLVINFYKMDASGDLVLLSTSPDLSTTVSSGVEWYLWDLATPIFCNAGDVIGVEFQIETSGSVNAYGYTAPVTVSHPTAAIKQLGFSQNWGAGAATITAGSIGWSQYAPYVGLGVGSPPPTPYFPQSNSFTTNGSYTIHSWAQYVDLIVLGDGGGGEGELGFATGYGGTGGSWNTQTLVVGTDIAAGTTFTVTVGQGGAGGPYFTAGSNGTGTTIAWLDIHGSAQSLIGVAGFGGNHTLGLSHNILGTGLAPNPQNETYQGSTYIGGAPQYTANVGNAPGGGGYGASFFQYGTAGAPGQAWIVDRQT